MSSMCHLVGCALVKAGILKHVPQADACPLCVSDGTWRRQTSSWGKIGLSALQHLPTSCWPGGTTSIHFTLSLGKAGLPDWQHIGGEAVQLLCAANRLTGC